MRYLMALFFGVASALQGQVVEAQITEVVPKVLYLEAGGRQVTVILRGKSLQSLRQVQVLRQGQQVRAIYSRLGTASENRRTVSFIANTTCPLVADYQVIVTLSDGTPVVLPLSLAVVKVGDPKATLPDTATLAEAADVKAGRRIVVAEPLAPVVTATIPAPLVIPPDGKLQKVLIQGKNLKEITEVRVRKSGSPPRYKGAQGLLPFRKILDGVEVEVVAATTTAVGTEFILDLLVKRYLAASVLMKVGYPDEKKAEIVPVQESNVIPLIPVPGP